MFLTSEIVNISFSLLERSEIEIILEASRSILFLDTDSRILNLSCPYERNLHTSGGPTLNTAHRVLGLGCNLSADQVKELGGM